MLRNTIAVLLTVLAMACSSPAQSVFVPGQRAPLPPQTGDITLSGVVVNSVTGEPIPRALVQMNGYQSRTVLADETGRFQFQNLPPMQVMLMARKPGYFNAMEFQHNVRLKPLEITSGMSAVTLSLVPAAVVTGHVTDTEGEPVEGINLRLKFRTVQNGRSQWIDRSSATTDEDGAFRMGNLLPGTYYLYTSGADRLLAMTDETYGAVYYPGVSEITNASPIHARAGQTSVADLTLAKQRAFRIVGTLAGVPAGENAFIQLLSTDGEPMGIESFVRSGTNTFEVRRIPAGSYILHAVSQPNFGPGLMGRGGGRGMRRMPEQYIGRLPLTVNGDMAGLVVPLQPAADIPVSIQTDFSNPTTENTAPMATFHSQPVRVYVGVTLHRVDGQGIYGAEQDAKGSMTFRGIEPGRYRVEVMPTSGNTYVQSATFGNTDLLHQDLVISGGGEQQSINIVVADDPAYISGTAQCGDAACWVLIVPDDTVAVPARTVYVTPQGTFRSSPLAPGTYRIYAFDSVDGLEYNNPEAMKRYSSDAQAVAVSAGQQAQVSVRMEKVVSE